MCDGVFDLGRELAQPLPDLVEIGDARHDIENLTAAVALANDRFAQRHRVVWHHKGTHRQPVDRRRCDDAHLAHPRQCQLQCARDRGCGQCQDMHIGLELLQFFFLRDAKMLLLIDDQEAEMGKPHIFGEQRMGADDDVDTAVGEFLLDLARLLGWDETGELRDPKRQPGEPLGEAAKMLPGEQRRRHHHRDLRARHRRDKRGAQCDLGLAEADIAADQPVHRLARGHIGERVSDRVQLVIGFGVREAGGEFLVDPFRGRQHLAWPQLALGGDTDQLAGDVADALLDAGLA